MFGFVHEHEQKRGLAFLFYSCTHVAGGPVLAALVSGVSYRCVPQN